MSARPSRICFAVPGMYPLLNPAVPGFIGGSESRALTFARGLSRLDGYHVSAIAFDYGQRRVQRCGAITIYRDDAHCLRAEGPRNAFLRRGWQTLAEELGIPLPGSAPPEEKHAWRKAKADVYCTFGVSGYTGRLARWCREKRRRLLLFAGSEMDFSAENASRAEGANIYGSRFGDCYDAVMLPQQIVVQTRSQAQVLHERFHRQAVVIPNPINLTGTLAFKSTRQEGTVLWIGKAHPIKRPELVVELARLCPGVRFKMVLNRVDDAIYENIAAARPKNVEIIERVPPEQIGDLFAESLACLNTSEVEGFPNTFLEAGKYAVPVLSLSVDPDGMITKHAGGFVAQGNPRRLAKAIREFHADPEAAARAGRNWHEYVVQHHAMPERIRQLHELLQAMLRPPGGAR